MCEESQTSQEMRYTLHSVVVHVGMPLEGSYCVYVRKGRSSSWVKLDGDEVSEVSEEEAIAANFGRIHQIYLLML